MLHNIYNGFYDLLTVLSGNNKEVTEKVINAYREQIAALHVELSKTSDMSERLVIWGKIRELNELINKKGHSHQRFNREILICGTTVIIIGISGVIIIQLARSNS
ncbi:MAG: hypothetical protein WD511_00890 [Balneolaceae bacterium]